MYNSDNNNQYTNQYQYKLNYDWNLPLTPGTIVCSKYNDFDGQERIGLFCVVYDEQLDNNVFEKKNVLCLKLSTQYETFTIPVRTSGREDCL